jgi:hypothetical protein
MAVVRQRPVAARRERADGDVALGGRCGVDGDARLDVRLAVHADGVEAEERRSAGSVPCEAGQPKISGSRSATTAKPSIRTERLTAT